MTRRFQFSLRAMLAATAIACLALGGSHLLMTYGQYVSAVPTRMGEPIVVYGRIVRPFGPKRMDYAIAWNRIGDKEPRRRNWLIGSCSYRKWLCLYDIHAELTGIYAGEYDLYVTSQPFRVVDDGAIRGKMTIRE